MAEFHLSPSFQPRTFHNSLKEADPFLSAPFRSVFSTLCNLARGPKSLFLCSALRGVAGSLTLDPVRAGLEGRLRGLGLQTGRLSAPCPAACNLQPMAGPGASPGPAPRAAVVASDPHRDVQCCPARQPRVSQAGPAPFWVETALWDPWVMGRGGGAAQGPGRSQRWHFPWWPWQRALEIQGSRETSARVGGQPGPTPFSWLLGGWWGTQFSVYPSSFSELFEVPFWAWVFPFVERV